MSNIDLRINPEHGGWTLIVDGHDLSGDCTNVEVRINADQRLPEVTLTLEADELRVNGYVVDLGTDDDEATA